MFTHGQVQKKSRKWKVAIIILLVIFALSGVGVGTVSLWYRNGLQAYSSDKEAQTVTIKNGSSPHDIAAQLQSSGLVRSSRIFELYARFHGVTGQLKAGSYELSPSMTTPQVVAVLVEGKEASTLFTIGPGLRVDQIRNRFIKAGFSASDVDSALNLSGYKDISLITSFPSTATLEGLIYPETFQVTPSTTPKDIIRQALNELNAQLTPQLIAGFKKHNLTAYEGITLASIVEKEVPGIDDRKIVAQIFEKRLAEGISLGSDATYFYASAVFGGEPTPVLDSPYNTRRYSGLPPGPINNVSKTALEAVAFPSDTNYLFFVTGDDGVNHFTSTEAEHNAAVRQYCKITCAPDYVPPGR